MKPSIQTLGQILYSPSQYVIPVFQRSYRWDSPQWEKLWNSLKEIQAPEKCGNHFMGFLVFVPGLAQPGQHTTFHLIDGQQRLTTSSILLAAIRNVAKASGQPELADEIHQYYLVHPLKKGDLHFRLLPKERDHENYLAMVSENAQIQGRISQALKFFEEKLTTLVLAEPTDLRRMFDTVCQRLEFMCATLETENAYNIFKSLNSTGIPLDQSDLIRNFVFMHVKPEEHDEFDEKFWGPLEKLFVQDNVTLNEELFSRFLRDFLMSSGKYLPPKETFSVFEARYEATAFNPKALAQELLNNAKHYAIISSRQEDESGDVSRALADLNSLESRTTYPLLLALMRKRASGSITAAQLVVSIRKLQGFILRRFVCSESSRGYGQIFVRAIERLSEGALRGLHDYLVERGWPEDLKFMSNFVEFPLYQRGYAREILTALERSYGHREPADLQSVQIEHIMPQTLSAEWSTCLGKEAERIHSEWLHRPGNLTLSDYNQELWNHPFSKKRVRYEQSNVVMTRELGSLDSWEEEEMRSRGWALAKFAVGIWMGPQIGNEIS